MIPRWQDDPPPERMLPHMPLVRVKPGVMLSGAVTTTQIHGVPTHYYGRRTLPCLADDCPGCAKQMPSRWEGYIGLWSSRPSKHLIVALTPGAATGIIDTAKDPKNLRAVYVEICRTGRAANSRLVASCKELEIPSSHLPPIPDLRAHLLHIWGLDLDPTKIDPAHWAETVRDSYNRNGQPGNA
jgi:hypothetical protein